jgi:hypothetical protein
MKKIVILIICFMSTITTFIQCVSGESNIKQGIYYNVQDKHKFIIIKNDSFNYNCWTTTPINSKYNAINNLPNNYKFIYKNNDQAIEDTFIYLGSSLRYRDEDYKYLATNSTIEIYLLDNKIDIFALTYGMKAFNISVDDHHNVYYNNKFIVKLLPEEKDILIIDKLSPTKRYISFVSYDPDKGGCRLFIIDKHMNSLLMMVDGFDYKTNLLNPIEGWISWSPNEDYALISHVEEFGILYNLEIINLKSKQEKVVPIRNFEKIYKREGNLSIKEIQTYDLESLKWVTNSIFSINITLHCHISDDCNCNENKFEKILRSYNANVNILTNEITYKILK